LIIIFYPFLLQYEKAAELFKRHKQYERCGKLYERFGRYNKAVNVLFENELYGLAFDIFERHADEVCTHFTSFDFLLFISRQQCLNGAYMSYIAHDLCQL
jgi:hypothetical protein